MPLAKEVLKHTARFPTKMHKINEMADVSHILAHFWLPSHTCKGSVAEPWPPVCLFPLSSTVDKSVVMSAN